MRGVGIRVKRVKNALILEEMWYDGGENIDDRLVIMLIKASKYPS